MREVIETTNAPAAIGNYSQAVKANNTIYFSGQIGLDPTTKNLVSGGISAEAKQVFDNLQAVVLAAGGSLDAVVKLTVFLLEIAHLAVVNDIMASYFKSPFPARTSIAVSALPKGAAVEVEAIMVLNSPAP
jgi:reactive intermediate/imine deaminase